MAPLPRSPRGDLTLLAGDAALVARAQQQPPRSYLGFSEIRRPEHDLQQNLRQRPEFSAAAIRCFEDEHCGEEKHSLTCSTPGECHTVPVTIEANPRHAAELIRKAERVLRALGWA